MTTESQNAAVGKVTQPKRRKTCLILVPLVFVALTLTCGLALFFLFRDDEPSDQELIANFTQHEQGFAELVAMSNADKKMMRIALDWTEPELEGGRWKEYKNLFSATGCSGGLSRYRADSPSALYFCAYSRGLLNRGFSKGYAYSETPLRDTLQNRYDRGGGRRYQPIKDHWYLFWEK